MSRSEFTCYAHICCVFPLRNSRISRDYPCGTFFEKSEEGQGSLYQTDINTINGYMCNQCMDKKDVGI
jgi:hypothetical protein